MPSIASFWKAVRVGPRGRTGSLLQVRLYGQVTSSLPSGPCASSPTDKPGRPPRTPGMGKGQSSGPIITTIVTLPVTIVMK